LSDNSDKPVQTADADFKRGEVDGLREGFIWAREYAKESHLRMIGEGDASFTDCSGSALEFLVRHSSYAQEWKTKIIATNGLRWEGQSLPADMHPYERGWNHGFVSGARDVWEQIKDNL
jgi:hypothetical protein